MTTGDVPVVWLAPNTNANASTSATHTEAREESWRALASFASAHGFRLRRGSHEAAALRPVPRLQSVDPGLAAAVETELERARTSLAAADVERAEHALSLADSWLREHPELPEAAWLRAEVFRTWAVRWARAEPRDDARAETAWVTAEALAAGRMPGLGDVTFPGRARRRIPVTFTVNRIESADAPMTAWFDSEEVRDVALDGGIVTYTHLAAPGDHAVVIALDGEPVLATWLTVEATVPGQPSNASYRFHLERDVDACDLEALAPHVTRVANARDRVPIAAESVTCERWLAAEALAAPGSLRVAMCQKNECESFVEWRSSRAVNGVEGGAAREASKRASSSFPPAWLAWTGLGLGAAAAVTTLGLFAAGAFNARSRETRFVSGGVRVE